MLNTQPTQSEEERRAALERIRDMADTILAETNNLLSAGNIQVRLSAPEPSPVTSPSDLGHAQADLKSFRDDLRENGQTHNCIGFYAMEYLAREAQQVLQRAMELGVEWSESARQSLAGQLRQAQAEAEELAVRLIQVGLKDFLKLAKDQAVHLKKHPDLLSPWGARTIRDGSENLDREWDEKIKAKCADMLSDARREALTIADELETAAHLNNIETALHKRISNIMSVQRVREELSEATEFLGQKGSLTPELQQRIRQGQERAARFRAGKKLSDARVAEAAGRNRPAERLKKEASALLAQD